MTPAEFTAAVKTLGLTHVRLATILDVTIRTVGHWKAGTRSVPGPVALILRYLVKRPELAEEIISIALMSKLDQGSSSGTSATA